MKVRRMKSDLISSLDLNDSVKADLRAADRAAKSRLSRLMSGKIGTRSFYDGIMRDLETSARQGKIHRYAIVLAMYEDTIREIDGEPFLQRMMLRCKRGMLAYAAQGTPVPPIPF